MKKLLLFAFTVFAFTACTQNDVEELSANRADVPETLTVGFEGGDDTRIQLNEAQKTVWNAGDEVSVFYKSYDNLKFQFQGKTGDRSGALKMVDGEVGTQTMGHVVVAYPYSTSYRVSDGYSGIEAILPATQTYLNGSYGEGGNIMVAQSEFTTFTLKNVCGWLRIDLTGDGEKVQHIKFRGNNGEQVAGLVYIDTETAEATLATEVGGYDDEENSVGGGLMFEDSIFTEITLSCGEGVALGSTTKSFYIGLLPQTFEKGVAVEILCDGYKPMTLATTSEVVIERNHIKPMAAVEFEAEEGERSEIPNNEIWYTATAKVEADSYYPWTFDTFGANIVSNEWDSESGEGVITFDADVTTIGNSAFRNCYRLTSITIPDSVTTIGNSAFADCSSLTSVTIPDSVTTIGQEAFRDCDSLTSVTIGDSVTTIGEAAFASCTNLVEFNGKFASEDGRCLIIESLLNSFAIGCGATEYTIPDSVTTIGNYAFYECKSLTSITIPDSVTTIGDSAFAYCYNLTSVTIPDSVTTIGNFAFYGCSSLISVYCEATTPPSLGGSYVFDNNASDRKIYVPAASVEAYKIADYWSEYADAIVGNGPTPEFEPTHIANECMWGGYSSISWGNYYNVQGENFSLQLHFCTDVALENSIAAGNYEWVTNSAITNSNPERFSTRTFTVNGNSVAVDSGKATVKVSGEEYTINLTLDDRYGNTYCIQYVGKLNVRYEDPNEGGEDEGNDDGDPNTITLNTFVYNADLRSNYLGYLFKATAENVELGICISSKNCSPTHIDAGDYTYNQYPDDLPFAFQLRGSKINGTDVSQDSNATMNVAVNGGVYTITIVTNGYTLIYNGTL